MKEHNHEEGRHRANNETGAQTEKKTRMTIRDFFHFGATWYVFLRNKSCADVQQIAKAKWKIEITFPKNATDAEKIDLTIAAIRNAKKSKKKNVNATKITFDDEGNVKLADTNEIEEWKNEADKNTNKLDKHDIFISVKISPVTVAYTEDGSKNRVIIPRKDVLTAKKIYRKLVRLGYKPYFSAKCNKAGDDWRGNIIKSIHTAKFMVLCSSNERFTQSPLEKYEWTEYQKCGEKTLIPLHVGEKDDVRVFSDIHNHYSSKVKDVIGKIEEENAKSKDVLELRIKRLSSKLIIRRPLLLMKLIRAYWKLEETQE